MHHDVTRIYLEEEEYTHLRKTAGKQVDEFVATCNDIRDGVFKAAAARGLNDDETAILLRAVLIKTAAENSQVRELASTVTAALTPLRVSV